LVIFQSSGTGKSRTIQQLPKENFYVTYICLRGVEEASFVSKGYPPRSRNASNLFSCKKFDDVVSFIKKIYEECQASHKTPQQWFTNYYPEPISEGILPISSNCPL